MAHVITPDGRDLGDVTDVGQLDYYRREVGFTIDGETVPEPQAAPASDDVTDPPVVTGMTGNDDDSRDGEDDPGHDDETAE